MNLFSRLAEILALDSNGLFEKAEDLESVFAWNRREMEEDLMGVKRYAAKVVAVERGLARELNQHRARAEFWQRKAREFLLAGKERLARRALVRKKEQEESVRRLETDCRAALQNRERAKSTLHSLETWVAEVCRRQRSILALHRAAAARLDLHRRATAGALDSATIKARLRRLVEELTAFEEELIVQAEAHEDLDAPDREAVRQDVAEELRNLKHELGAE